MGKQAAVAPHRPGEFESSAEVRFALDAEGKDGQVFSRGFFKERAGGLDDELEGIALFPKLPS
jgi:hypothetical protein